jgi:ubiquinol-cytochrome c reductase core subunit 2
MAQFFEETFTGGRMAVVGMGVDHGMLEEFARSLPISGGQGVAASGKYGGGECRVQSGGSSATVAVAYEGAGWGDQKGAVTAAVLQQALGTGPHVQWGNGAGALQKAVAKATETYSVTGLNASYSDSGLVGFLLTTSAADAGKATKAAQAVLKGSLSDADVARGKAQLTTMLWSAYETGAGFTESLGEVAAVTGKAVDAKTVQGLIDSVTASDVNSMLKKATGAKASMGAVGNLMTVPYLDEL